jgi:hypothetical protein
LGAHEQLPNTSLKVPYTGATTDVNLGTEELAAAKVETGVVYPAADGVTAVQIRKADGTTSVLNVDTTNARVGIGTAAPAFPLEVSTAVANTALKLQNTAASAAGGGAGASAYSNDGAAMASGDRLGYMLFGGSSSASALRNTAGFFAYAAQAWVDAAKYGTQLTIETTLNDATGRTVRLTIDGSGNFDFAAGNLVTTGTLGAGAITGTSLTDGTATLDDGSLTAAVNGTFSGDVTAGDLVLGAASEHLVCPTFSLAGTQEDTARVLTIQFRDYGGTNAGKYIGWTGWQATAAHGATAEAVTLADAGKGIIVTAHVANQTLLCETDSDGCSEITITRNSGPTTVYFMVINPSDGKVYSQEVILDTAIP